MRLPRSLEENERTAQEISNALMQDWNEFLTFPIEKRKEINDTRCVEVEEVRRIFLEFQAKRLKTERRWLRKKKGELPDELQHTFGS